jgi:rhodanese-related sulfurtransferase
MRDARPLRGILGLLLLLVAAGACAAGPTIEPDELAKRIEAGDAPLVLDVRTPEEFERGHVPGAVNISHDKLGAHLDELAEYKDEQVVVYCRLGPRARKAQAALEQAGFTDVVELKGDYMGWRAAGHPAEKGDQSESDEGAQPGGSK